MGKINYTLLNTSVLNASRLNMTGETGKPGGGAGGYWPAGTPAAIRRSAVLWYDIAKQGATNETMAANPVLKDLSGHGHDATCYNFGWTEGSGISTTNYPGALVSDGVDDYAYVDGLPILTKEKGYTVIAKRKWIGEPESKSQGFISKGTNAKWIDGAFYFECVEGGGSAQFNRVFDNPDGKSGVNYLMSGFIQEDITYLTSNKYNNFEIKNIGDGVDTDKLVIFRLGTEISGNYGNIALYSVLLFNRDLTAEEIEWVKNNLIENNYTEQELDASLVDAWVFSGYRNEDAPKSVTGEKGHALALGNFAYTEGSGFADGRLVTDGVDDYAENLEMPALTDYTFITRRTLMNFEIYASVASKAYGAGTNGAFLFECRNLSTSGSVPDRTASFEPIKEGTIINNAIPEEVSWQTKNSYNGRTLSPGNLADGKLFYLASTRTTGNCVAAKFAWCALYDRSLTEEEINAEVAKLDALWEARKV